MEGSYDGFSGARVHRCSGSGAQVLRLRCTPISDEGLATYLKSVARFKDATSKAKVEIVTAMRVRLKPDTTYRVWRVRGSMRLTRAARPAPHVT
jgi:hypothetical protein